MVHPRVALDYEKWLSPHWDKLYILKEAERISGCEILKVSVAAQPVLSVTVTVYNPAARFEISCVGKLPGDQL